MKLRARDALRALIGGSEAVAVRGAAFVLFQSGGQKLLPIAAQTAVRATLERHAARLMTGTIGALSEAATGASGVRILERGAAARGAAVSAARVAAAPTARIAAQQVMRGIGRAAGAGALIDGAWGAAEAAYRVHNGTMTGRDAVVHVAKEASTGAVATAAGAAVAAAAVTLTGGLAIPAVFAVGAAASIAAKVGLTAWIDGRAITARAPAADAVGVPVV